MSTKKKIGRPIEDGGNLPKRSVSSQYNPLLLKPEALEQEKEKLPQEEITAHYKTSLSLSKSLISYLTRNPEKANAIVRKLVTLAIGGNLEATKEILNRVDGKVAEIHRIDSENPVTLLFTPVIQTQLLPPINQDKIIDVKPIEYPALEQESLVETNPTFST